MSDTPKTFIERALPLVRRGYYVFPLSSDGRKIPLIADWPNQATNVGSILVNWSQEWPDANVGCIGRYVCCLDDDRGDLAERYERETGKKFPHTYTVITSVKSTGMHGKHHHFLETPESIEMGSRRLPAVFDFQADWGHQFVGPYSVHKSGWVYAPEDPKAKLIPIPADVLEWIDDVSPKPKEHTEDSTLIISSEWSPEKWIDHYNNVFTLGANGVSSICPLTYSGPATGHKHTNSTETGFRFDRGHPEFHCFSTDPDDNGKPHDMASFGDVVRHLNQYHTPYPGKIWEKTPEQEEAYQAELADIMEAMGVEPVIDLPEAEVGETVRLDNDGTRYVEREGQRVNVADEPEPEPEPKEEPEPEPKEEPETPAPAMRAWGAFPEEALYGYLGSLARKLESPLGYAYPTTLAVYAGRWARLGTRTVRGNIFVIDLGDTSTGKTRTQNRALYVIRNYSEDGGDLRTFSQGIGSGEGLVQALGGKPDKDIEPFERLCALPCLLHQDETRELFGKMAIDGSSLPYKLNRLYDNDDVAGATKKGSVTAFAKASFLGGLTVASPAEFAEMFGKSTVTGLYVRFIYGYTEGGWRFHDEWEEFDAVPPEIHEPVVTKFTPEIFKMKEDWEMVDQKERGQRLSQLALRVAAITASANGDEVVTPECMKAALRLMEWQQEIRDVFKPSHGDSMGGKYSEFIMEEAWSHIDTEGFIPFQWRDAYRRNRWFAKDGSQLKRQRDHLVEVGMLIKVDVPKSKALWYRAAKYSREWPGGAKAVRV